MVTELIDENKAIECAHKSASVELKDELLNYLNRFPNTRFDWRIIAHNVDWKRRSNIAETLELLVADKLIVKHTGQGSHLFSITTES